MKSLKLAFLYINLLVASTVIAQEDPFLSIIVDAGESITTNINTMDISEHTDPSKTDLILLII